MHLSKQSLPDFADSLQQGRIFTMQLSLGHWTGQLVVSTVIWNLPSVSLVWLHHCLCSEVVGEEGDAADCSKVREATSWALKPLLVGWLQVVLPNQMVLLAGLYVHAGMQTGLYNWMGLQAVLCNQVEPQDVPSNLTHSQAVFHNQVGHWLYSAVR